MRIVTVCGNFGLRHGIRDSSIPLVTEGGGLTTDVANGGDYRGGQEKARRTNTRKGGGAKA